MRQCAPRETLTRCCFRDADVDVCLLCSFFFTFSMPLPFSVLSADTRALSALPDDIDDEVLLARC